jgi:dTDP-4-dehydrorhamnose reductase
MRPERRPAFLIAGAKGMLGTALQRTMTARSYRFTAPAERAFDVTDAAGCLATAREFAATLRPGEHGVLINAAAFTDVERAEDEPERAFLVNKNGAENLAVAARDAGLRFVHVSTDFVFDGAKTGAYTETDEPHPASAYGDSKLAGELVVLDHDRHALIVRTAWVFGEAGTNFPVKILDAARAGKALRVVTDEVGSPTYTLDLAGGILTLLEGRAQGIFHLTGSGSCTRYELARAVLDAAGLATIAIEPVTGDGFPTKAQRPKNSVLDCTKAASLGVILPSWRDAVSRFVAEIDAGA